MPRPSSVSATGSGGSNLDGCESHLQSDRTVIPPKSDRVDEGDDVDGDEDEEVEYEEIEVEEEVEVEEEEEIEVEDEEEEEEVEEEVEEEEEEEEEEEGDREEIEEVNSDVSRDVEPVGNDKQLVSHPTSEESETKLTTDSLVEDSAPSSKCSDPSNEPVKTLEEPDVIHDDSNLPNSGVDAVIATEDGTLESSAKEKDSQTLRNEGDPKECGDPFGDTEAQSCKGNVLVVECTNTSAILGKDVSNPLGMVPNDCLYEKAGCEMDAEKEVMSIDMELDDDDDQTSSRLVVHDTRTRKLSPCADTEDGAKRQAVICDFFAKGWCVRGSTCMFLHVRDIVDSASANRQIRGGATVGNFTNADHQSDQGLRDTMENSKPTSFFDQVVSSIGTPFSSHFSSGRTLQEPQFPSSKNEPRFPFPFKDFKMENSRQNWTDSGYYGNTTSLTHNNLVPGYASPSSGSFALPGKYCNEEPSSHFNSLEMLSFGRSRIHGMVPAYHIPARTGSSFPFSSSLNINPVGPQKPLDGDRDYQRPESSSMPQSGSQIPAFDCEKLPTSVAFGDPLHDAGSKSKANGWEPSIPFRPSFFISPISSSPGIQYDPLRDSFDSPNIGCRSFKFTFVSDETPALDKSNQPTQGDSVLSRTLDQDFNASGTGNVNDVHQSEGSKFKKDLIMDQVGENDEVVVDQTPHGKIQKDSKAVRYFRASLIDFVKEILKPTWREGHLSKDAHNIIVKKAVEKILSTLQPNQIPPTLELTKQYLSISRQKIEKLVEAYVTKYGKS